MSEHTKEPWTVRDSDLGGKRKLKIVGPGRGARSICYSGNIIGLAPLSRTDRDKANLRRIVACVNACKGIATHRLEESANGRIADCVEAMDSLSDNDVAFFDEKFILEKRR